MCGFVGVVGRPLDGSDIVTRGVKKIAHRGPDHTGYAFSSDKSVFLGHVRLAVHGLETASNQPMTSNCGRYTLVYNGELYNFRELRKFLKNDGYRFFTTGDSEVLLLSYIAWGEKCLNRFNGMFSFVIYDRGDGSCQPKIFFARDRAGEKPFYFSRKGSEFIFASELKALSPTGAIDLKALNFYLALGYVPYDMCLFEGISKLPAAHCGVFDIASGAFKVWRYWSLPAVAEKARLTGAELADQAGSLLEQSVRLRLSSDVPVGVLLSGGLDSSLVASAAARVSSRPVRTFTIALPGSPLDEAHHAKKVADFLGAEHHVLELEKPEMGLLDSIAPMIDEPIADSSIVPAWLVFGLARQQVTVALGGDGGDELFGGYTSYRTALNDVNNWGWLPRSTFAMAANLAGRLPAGVKGRNKLYSLIQGPARQYIYGTAYFDSVLRSRLLNYGAIDLCSGNSPESFLQENYERGGSQIDKMTRMDFNTILPEDFLVKVDRASMAHSLEVRAPMLDHRLVEFCFSQIPDEWKVKKHETRRLQRRLAESWLPPNLDTHRKQGFSIPVNEWFRSEGESKLMDRMEGLPDVVNLDEVRSLVRGHLAGRASGGRLFALVMLAIAMRNIKS